jgi:hypothetical protein
MRWSKSSKVCREFVAFPDQSVLGRPAGWGEIDPRQTPHLHELKSIWVPCQGAYLTGPIFLSANTKPPSCQSQPPSCPATFPLQLVSSV